MMMMMMMMMTMMTMTMVWWWWWRRWRWQWRRWWWWWWWWTFDQRCMGGTDCACISIYFGMYCRELTPCNSMTKILWWLFAALCCQQYFCWYYDSGLSNERLHLSFIFKRTMAFVVVSWTLIAISEKPTLLARQAFILHCHTTQYLVKVLEGTSYDSAASAIFAVFYALQTTHKWRQFDQIAQSLRW